LHYFAIAHLVGAAANLEDRRFPNRQFKHLQEVSDYIIDCDRLSLPAPAPGA
jgi:hypothetical protein